MTVLASNSTLDHQQSAEVTYDRSQRQRRQMMMAARLAQGGQLAPTSQAPMGGGIMPLSGGGDAGGVPPAGLLAGMNAQQLAQGMQAMRGMMGPDPAAQRFGATGLPQDGFGTGKPGLFGTPQNSQGADVLQQLGMFNSVNR